jgi:serine/threonine protein kinase
MPIGRGGWSEVWQARCPAGGDCALKFMPCDPDLAPAKEIRAIQALRHVKHEYLLEVRNVWSCAGYVVVVMDLCDGSMLDLLEIYLHELNEPMTADHACYFLCQAARAIDFLNTRQHLVNGQRVAIRHCDIKPSNLLIQGRTVKVADFGLAVPATADRWYHRGDGTPVYSAPEVFQGWLSDRSDQYSLAISYYQLRTGQLPFADCPPKITRHYIRPAPDLSGVCAAEREVLARALAAAPQNRWGSCVELMERLGACCATAAAS